MIILAQMLILSEYPNNKKTYYIIYKHHCLVHKLQTCGLCPMRNKDKIVSLTVFRKEEYKRVKYNDSGDRNGLT